MSCGEVGKVQGGGRLKLCLGKGLCVTRKRAAAAWTLQISGWRETETGARMHCRRDRRRCEFTDSELNPPRGTYQCTCRHSSMPVIRASIDAASGHTIHSDFPEIHVTTERPGDWAKAVWRGPSVAGGPV